MARPNQEAIETFINITGASEAIAGQKLEAHGGNLNAAVNAYFSEGDRNAPANAYAPSIVGQEEFMDVDDDLAEVEPRGPYPSLPSAPLQPSPDSLLNPDFGKRFEPAIDLNQIPEPQFTRPVGTRQIPIEFKDSTEPSGPSGTGPVIEDVTDLVQVHGPDIRGTVTLDDDDDNEDDDEVMAGSVALAGMQRDSFLRNRFGGPSNLQDNDVEEQMIRAAIEASKMEVDQSFSNQPFSIDSGQREPRLEDPELEHAVSLSLKTAEKEKALRDQGQSIGESSKGASESAAAEPKLEPGPESSNAFRINGRLNRGRLFAVDDVEDLDEPLVRHRSKRVSADSVESIAKDVDDVEDSPPLSPRPRSNAVASTESNGNAFHSEDWGGLSSLEHDEAVMLEAAMFGGIPEGTRYQRFQAMGSTIYPRPTPRPPSPTLTAQRMIREQQDDEYLASLQADREKEQKALEEAEARLEEERRKEEESRKTLEEEKELERLLAEKEATLPEEPSSDDEKAVNLMVRMPDGSRRGRRFLKSDNLQSLFDFIDIGRTVKPGSYRLIRTYPRRAFEEGESAVTLNELGLTNKQEALYLELI